MNSYKLFKICRHFLRYRPYRNITNIKNMKFPFRNTTKLIFYSTVAIAGFNLDNNENYNKDYNDENDSEDNNENDESSIHTTLLNEEFSIIELKLTDLIKILRTAITETCEKYRSCLEKQMQVIETGTNMDPRSEHWDKLVELRNQAADLKSEFDKFKDMIEHVGQAAMNLALCSALINENDADRYLCNDFFDLERISKEETEENKRYEKMLLQIKMRNIIHTNDGLPRNKDKKKK